MHRRAWLRRWAIVWAVLQFALPTAALYADAHVERESRAQVSHVESTSGTSCRPQHPAECALCHLATQSAVGTRTALPPAIEARLGCPARTVALEPSAGHGGRRPPARAPPASRA